MPIHYLVINEYTQATCNQYHTDYKNAIKCFANMYQKDSRCELIAVRTYATYSIYNANTRCKPTSQIDIQFLDQMPKDLEARINNYYQNFRVKNKSVKLPAKLSGYLFK